MSKKKTPGAPPPIRNRIKKHIRMRAGDLVPHELNFRQHPSHQRAALEGLYEEVGFARSVLAYELPDGRLKLLDGHLRRDIRPDMEIDVEVLDVNADEAKLLLSAIDPLTALATTNDEKLKELLQSLSPENAAVKAMLDALALENKIDLGGPPADVPEPQLDRAAALQKKWRTARGQLWEIPSKSVVGKCHRLLCGDSTKGEDIARVMGGEKAGLMNTDPPYGVNLDQSWRDVALGSKAMGPGNAARVANDDQSDWTEAFRLFTGDIVYAWHASACHAIVSAALEEAGFEVRQQIVWNKSVMIMGRSAYHWKHEPCWYAVRKGATAHWCGDRKQTTVWDAISPNHIMAGSEEEKTEHPTQKPAELFRRPIINHLRPGDLAYEPFAGSGTQFCAAEQLARLVYGLEIEPRYCAVILQRLADMGLEPRRVAQTSRTGSLQRPPDANGRPKGQTKKGRVAAAQRTE